MTAPAWLIAEREFRAYTATASFWVALAVGPLAMGGALALTSVSGAPAPPPVVIVRASDPVLTQSARAALADAERLEDRPAPAGAGAGASLDLVPAAGGGLDARFSAGFPLSASGRALVTRTIERDMALRSLTAGGATATARVREIDPPPARAADTGALSRFALVMILWLTLTGSLGMLLQAVVRERANRALEGLLAAARPWEIVLGKIAGVGGVSALVLVAWLGSAWGLAALSPAGGGLAGAVIAGLATPGQLVRAVGVYGLAYLFYGLVTVAVGAAARDSAAAQNLARPMFAVLLAAFFAALMSLSGGGRLDWLVYVPPFTPFMLLLKPAGALSLSVQLIALSVLLAASAGAGRLAVARVTLSGAERRRAAKPVFSGGENSQITREAIDGVDVEPPR